MGLLLGDVRYEEVPLVEGGPDLPPSDSSSPSPSHGSSAGLVPLDNAGRDHRSPSYGGPTTTRRLETVTRVWMAYPQIRTDRRKDRVETSPEQMATSACHAERLSATTGVHTRVVGWYHSHPHITVLPSHVDVATQAMYQQLDPNFIGLIFSVFNSDPATKGGRIQVTAFQSQESSSLPPGKGTRGEGDGDGPGAVPLPWSPSGRAPGGGGGGGDEEDELLMLSPSISALDTPTLEAIRAAIKASAENARRGGGPGGGGGGGGGLIRREVPLSVVPAASAVEKASSEDLVVALRTLLIEEKTAFQRAVAADQALAQARREGVRVGPGASSPPSSSLATGAGGWATSGGGGGGGGVTSPYQLGGLAGSTTASPVRPLLPLFQEVAARGGGLGPGGGVESSALPPGPAPPPRPPVPSWGASLALMQRHAEYQQQLCEVLGKVVGPSLEVMRTLIWQKELRAWQAVLLAQQEEEIERQRKVDQVDVLHMVADAGDTKDVGAGGHLDSQHKGDDDDVVLSDLQSLLLGP